jgi:hypothetical protein
MNRDVLQKIIRIIKLLRTHDNDQEAEKFEMVSALEAELAKPEQEPVAWLYNGHLHECDPSDWAEEEVTPLYKTPTINKMPTKIFGPNLEQILNAAGFYRRQWVGLTDEQLSETYNELYTQYTRDDVNIADFILIARAVEALLKEKNNGSV